MKAIVIATIIFISCNRAEHERMTTVQVPSQLDSIIDQADSGILKLMEIDSFATLTTDLVTDRINELEQDKKLLEQQLSYEEQPVYKAAMESRETGPDVSGLLQKIADYEKQILILKKKIRYDSVFIANYLSKIKPTKLEDVIEKPNDSSLVIEFNNKLRGDVSIPVDKADVYVIPFSRKVKRLMQYEVYCNTQDIKDLNGKQALYYNGKYFSNDTQPGKYLIKVCYYYGGYEVIDRTTGYQTVKMNVSPPIQ